MQCISINFTISPAPVLPVRDTHHPHLHLHSHHAYKDPGPEQTHPLHQYDSDDSRSESGVVLLPLLHNHPDHKVSVDPPIPQDYYTRSVLAGDILVDAGDDAVDAVDGAVDAEIGENAVDAHAVAYAVENAAQI